MADNAPSNMLSFPLVPSTFPIFQPLMTPEGIPQTFFRGYGGFLIFCVPHFIINFRMETIKSINQPFWGYHTRQAAAARRLDCLRENENPGRRRSLGFFRAMGDGDKTW